MDQLNVKEQQEFQQVVEQKQMKDFMRLYSNLVSRCFDDCVNDFTSANLTSKESTCIYKCSEKFLKHSERVGLRFQEQKYYYRLEVRIKLHQKQVLMDSASTNQMHHILVAHVVNSIVSTSQIKNDVVDCELTKFLATLNKLLKDYQKTFDLEDKSEMIGSNNLRTIIQDSEFKQILNIHEDSVRIDATPRKLQTVLSNVLVNTAIRYSEILTSEVNELTEKYHSIDENALTEEPAEEGAEATEVKPEQVQPSELPAEDKMEVDNPPQVEESLQEGATNLETLSVPTEEVKEEQAPEPASEVPPSEPVEVEMPSVEQQDTVEEEQKEEEKPEATELIPEAVAPVDEEKDEDNLESATGPSAEEVADSFIQEQADDEVEDKAETKEETLVEADSALTPVGESEDKSVTATPEPTTAREDIDTEEPASPESTPKKHDLIKEDSRKRSSSPSAASQKHKRFQNIAVNLVKTIEEHRFSSPFLVPVNAKEYEQVIYEPKDLKSILKAIRQKDVQAYETVKELERDIMLMFANCVMYNKSSTHLVEMAKQMKDDVRKTFKMFEDAESGI
ncbi:mitochondrial import inner membrane translocase subunit TIM9 [Candidozyma haemuli]|uniref:Mitochondrial import inner membrane translocase subunit TIM9 n=1 Tax=Candidozyma haemuli TaxID=45357 RepID=A0A2V1AXR3_9ASCO|nr:mitochondrial import inner membrane translocase subunit TIM9 [[Candida] haemuloni]PVH22877.1 mitochondrial import inner membrane translocase subunit TIM9 [[Candida] haemuloni]